MHESENSPTNYSVFAYWFTALSQVSQKISMWNIFNQHHQWLYCKTEVSSFRINEAFYDDKK